MCVHSICSGQKYGKNRKKGHFKAVSFAVHGNFAVKHVIYVSRHCFGYSVDEAVQTYNLCFETLLVGARYMRRF